MDTINTIPALSITMQKHKCLLSGLTLSIKVYLKSCRKYRSSDKLPTLIVTLVHCQLQNEIQYQC